MKRAWIVAVLLGCAVAAVAPQEAKKWQKGKGWGWVWGAADEVGSLNEMTDALKDRQKQLGAIVEERVHIGAAELHHHVRGFEIVLGGSGVEDFVIEL